MPIQFLDEDLPAGVPVIVSVPTAGPTVISTTVTASALATKITRRNNFNEKGLHLKYYQGEEKTISYFFLSYPRHPEIDGKLKKNILVHNFFIKMDV